MKKAEAGLEPDPLDHEIDFSNGVRGRHYEAFRHVRNWVFIDPNVLKHFADGEAINAALREVIARREKTAKRSAKTARAPRDKK
jgi:hypothetical protein